MAVRLLSPCESFERDPERHDVNLLRRNAEIGRHEARVVFAHGGKPIHMLGALSNQRERLVAVRLMETIEEQVFALKGAVHRSLQRPPERTREAHEQRIRQLNDVGRRLADQPLEQLVEFLPLEAGLAFEHRDRQLAKRSRIGRDRSGRRGPQQPRSVEQACRAAAEPTGRNWRAAADTRSHRRRRRAFR